MTDRASVSELPASTVNPDVQDAARGNSAEDSSHTNVPAEDVAGARIYFMNINGQNADGSVFLSKVTFDDRDKDDLTGEDREVLDKPLSSPVELAYRGLHLLPVLDIDRDGVVTRDEIDSASKDSKYRGTDALVIAAFADPSAWDGLTKLSNDQRGNETGITSEDVWTIAEKQNDVAVQNAYDASLAAFHMNEMAAGN